MDNGTAIYLVRALEVLAHKIDELNEKLEELETISKSTWIKEEGTNPKCSFCGYYWREQTVGPVGSGHSDLDEAKYCPNCGRKMV